MQSSCDPTSRGRNKCNFVFVYGQWAPWYLSNILSSASTLCPSYSTCQCFWHNHTLCFWNHILSWLMQPSFHTSNCSFSWSSNLPLGLAHLPELPRRPITFFSPFHLTSSLSLYFLFSSASNPDLSFHLRQILACISSAFVLHLVNHLKLQHC